VARKRRGVPVHGWVVLDKPLGMSSFQAVAAVRRAFNAEKAGHGGTLDPLASGVLPIALGEATKTVGYVMEDRKSYRFRIRFGIQTSTDDAEGEAVATSDIRPDAAAIAAVLPRFQGEIEQVPPKYSAIKVEGQRAYALARGGEAVELQPRIVRVDAIRLAGMPDADHADIEVESGKGCYMRSLARDIALAAGSVGHVVVLRRTAVGQFREEGAISLDDLAAIAQSPAPERYLLPVETALDDIPALALTETEAHRLRHGQAVPLLRKADRVRLEALGGDGVAFATSAGKAVAVVRVEGGQIHPMRVLNL